MTDAGCPLYTAPLAHFLARRDFRGEGGGVYIFNSIPEWTVRLFCLFSDSVKRHLRGRHLSVLNLKFDFISDGGCTREEQIALSLKRHLFPHGGREPKAFWICFSTLPPILNIFPIFRASALKRHLLKRHLTLSAIYDTSMISHSQVYCWGHIPEYLSVFMGLTLDSAKTPFAKSPFSQGRKSAQGILRLENPNMGPNSGKRFLDARILGGGGESLGAAKP